MTTRLRVSMLASSILAGSVMAAAPAFAQGALPPSSPPPGIQSPEDTTPTESSSGEIVVTGTLIRNPALVSATPVQVTGQAEIQLRQANVAEELLRDLPGVTPSIGSGVNNGNAGFSFVDLRGIGANRNLVLLDGNRIVPGDLLGRVDLNNIPLALIDSVQNLTGGASTTYGADAISGVVNFITRSDFTGIDVNASEQLTEKGDGNRFRADVTIGGNFADDKGNLVLSLGYQKTSPIYQGARDYAITALDSFSGNPAGSSFPAPVAFDLTNNGFVFPGQTAPSFRVQVRPENGTFNNGLYQRFNFNPYNIFQLPFKRYNVYSAGHYEVADDIEVYGRGLYSKNITQTIVAPSGATGNLVTIPLSNPYLSTAQRNIFCADAGIDQATCTAAATATATIADPTNPARQIANPAYRTVTEGIRYRSVDVGPRVDRYETQVFDIRGGIRGKLTDTLRFDVNGSYGESTNDHIETGYVALTRLKDALLATNTTTCLSGNPGCVPVNVFGAPGAQTPAQIKYIGVPAFSQTRSSLVQVQGTINGDFGYTVPFAANPINFAVGADYRKYRALQTGDVEKTTPGELGLDSVLTPFSGGYQVVEGFGELIAPLVQDKPFFHDLSLETGIRYSRYEVKAPGTPKFNTTTYKGGANWTPVEGIKLRGTYQHAVRAPNIAELFQPESPGLTNLSVDPCQGAAPTTNANLRAVCIAQGAPVNRIGAIPEPASGQINTVTAGNLNLKPEVSNSYTAGIVLQPRRAVPGLTITVDYFRIKVTKAITSLAPGDAINACFANLSAASATSAACRSIGRNPTTGALDGDASTTRGLFLPLTNAGTIFTDGIDLGANYRRTFGKAALNLSFQGTWTNRSQFKSGPNAPNRECVGYYSTSCGSPAAPERGSLQPEFVWNQRTTVSIGQADMSVLWRHIGKMQQEPDDVANVNGPAFVNTATGVNFGRIKAQNYFDASVRISVTTNATFTITCENFLNKKPPIVGYDIGSTFFNSGNTYPATYDAIGRRFAVAGEFKF